MDNYIKKIGRKSIVISVFLFILAIFMITKPINTVGILLLIFGYILVVDGLIHFVSYFSIKEEYRFYSYELAQSILYIIGGFVIISNINAVTQSLSIILGIWIVIESILKIQIAFNIRDVRNANWVMMLFISCISIVLGALLILKPFESAETLVKISGVILAFTQLIEIYDDFYILSKIDKVERAIKEVKKAK